MDPLVSSGAPPPKRRASGLTPHCNAAPTGSRPQRFAGTLEELKTSAPPWRVLPPANTLDQELQREVAPGHLLCGAGTRAIAARDDLDDVLFEVRGRAFRFAVVHLTWRVEDDPQWPAVETYPEWSAFKAQRHDPDAAEWDRLGDDRSSSS